MFFFLASNGKNVCFYFQGGKVFYLKKKAKFFLPKVALIWCFFSLFLTQHFPLLKGFLGEGQNQHGVLAFPFVFWSAMPFQGSSTHADPRQPRMTQGPSASKKDHRWGSNPRRSKATPLTRPFADNSAHKACLMSVGSKLKVKNELKCLPHQIMGLLG